MMRTERPLDWQKVSRDWHAQAPGPALSVLQARLRRDAWRLRLSAAGDLVVWVAATLLILAVTVARPSRGVLAAAVVLLSMNVVIAVFAVRNRRGLWRSQAATPAGSLALMRARARAAIRAWRFASGAAVAQALAVVAYVGASVRDLEAPLRALILAVGLAGALVAAYFAAARRQTAAARHALGEADAIERLLNGSDAAGEGSRDPM